MHWVCPFSYLTCCKLFLLFFQEEIEVEGKLLHAGKSVGVVNVGFKKKRTGKLMAQECHTKYLYLADCEDSLLL
ncbi:hypothetical protein ACQJBY_069937 [Aegilops geniculata]